MAQNSLTGRILSVNVGQPRPIQMATRSVMTAIFKYPTEGRLAIHGHNIEGDRQADLRVHGGPYKAVYLYPSEHYLYWKGQLDLSDLPYGAFGENLTTSGLTEENVRIGDQFRFGTALLQVTQPRMPCFKLGLRFERSDMVKLFWKSGRSGIYFSVIEEGDLAAGDPIEKVTNGPEDITIDAVFRLYAGEEWSNELRERALRSPLRGGWKKGIQSRLTESDGRESNHSGD